MLANLLAIQSKSVLNWSFRVTIEADFKEILELKMCWNCKCQELFSLNQHSKKLENYVFPGYPVQSRRDPSREENNLQECPPHIPLLPPTLRGFRVHV